jgi:hypothetical protein
MVTNEVTSWKVSQNKKKETKVRKNQCYVHVIKLSNTDHFLPVLLFALKQVQESSSLLWVWHSKDGKVPHEPLGEFGDIGGGVRIDSGAVRDAIDIAPGVCVLVVKTTIINVFSH